MKRNTNFCFLSPTKLDSNTENNWIGCQIVIIAKSKRAIHIIKENYYQLAMAHVQLHFPFNVFEWEHLFVLKGENQSRIVRETFVYNT